MWTSAWGGSSNHFLCNTEVFEQQMDNQLLAYFVIKLLKRHGLLRRNIFSEI